MKKLWIYSMITLWISHFAWSTEEDILDTPSYQNPSRDWETVLQLGLGGGFGYFAATVHSRIVIHDFFQPGITLYYHQFNGDDYQESLSNIELPIIAQIMRKRRVSPFVGIGPGYQNWKRSDTQGDFDKSSTPTAFGVVGVNISLTKNFVFRIQQKETYFFQGGPYRKRPSSDKKSDRNKYRSEFQYSFVFQL